MKRAGTKPVTASVLAIISGVLAFVIAMISLLLGLGIGWAFAIYVSAGFGLFSTALLVALVQSSTQEREPHQ